MEETRAKIRAFLSRFFPNHQLRDGEDFFGLVVVNSLFAIQLMQFVESEFRVAVEQEDLDVNNFNSVDAIAALVGRKTALPTA